MPARRGVVQPRGPDELGRQVAVSDDESASIGVCVVPALVDVLCDLLLDGFSQHILGPFAKDFRQDVPARH